MSGSWDVRRGLWVSGIHFNYIDVPNAKFVLASNFTSFTFKQGRGKNTKKHKVSCVQENASSSDATSEAKCLLDLHHRADSLHDYVLRLRGGGEGDDEIENHGDSELQLVIETPLNGDDPVDVDIGVSAQETGIAYVLALLRVYF